MRVRTGRKLGAMPVFGKSAMIGISGLFLKKSGLANALSAHESPRGYAAGWNSLATLSLNGSTTSVATLRDSSTSSRD